MQGINYLEEARDSNTRVSGCSRPVLLDILLYFLDHYFLTTLRDFLLLSLHSQSVMPWRILV